MPRIADPSLGKTLTDIERKAAFNKELSSWKQRKALRRVRACEIAPTANIVGSHVVCRRKDYGSAKARIVPWGHRGKDRDFLRGDTPSIDLDIFRLVLSLATDLGWDVEQRDLKTAFLQALGFARKVYVRPPREVQEQGTLWLLLAAAYGLTESGRLWYLTSNCKLITNFGIDRCRYDYTLYYFRDTAGDLDFILAVKVDDYIYAGQPARMQTFETFLQETFEVSKLARNNLQLMDCTITQTENFSSNLSQDQALAAIDPSELLDAIERKQDGPATAREATAYRHTIGRILYICRLSSPWFFIKLRLLPLNSQSCYVTTFDLLHLP